MASTTSPSSGSLTTPPPTDTDTESLPSNPLAEKEDPRTYPEGGLKAWLVVLGAFSGLTASLGLYNTTGVFELLLSHEALSSLPPTKFAWLFSTYAFVVWICGVQIGPTFDVYGPTILLAAGTLCTFAGLVAMSFCRVYWQFLVAFSLLTGLGSSLLLTPSMACVAHWFQVKRGLASGVAFIGGGFGGVLFPLMIQALLPKVGWEWSVRVLAFVILIVCAISVAFCKSRVSPPTDSKGTAARGWKDTLPDHKIFLDGSGAMALTTAGALLTDLAYFIPVTYVPAYYLERQRLPGDEALSGSAAFAYQLLAILNAASCVGRFTAGGLADRYGRYNTMIVSLLLCTVSVLCFWLPDMLVPSLENEGLLVVFVLLFGFVSGSNVSLLPICLGQLCDTRDYGRYYASCFTVVAFGVLASIPIAGSLLEAVDGIGKEKYWGVAVFTGLSYVGAFGCFLWVRISVKGWDRKIKW